MLCPNCQANNPETNKFCGMCGSALVRPVESARVEEPVQPIRAYQPVKPEEYRPISGPSLLGLNTTEEEDTSSYLLDEDDQPRQSHAGWFAFTFVALAFVAVVGFLEWRAIQTGRIEFPSLRSFTGEAPKPQDAAAPSAPQAAGLAAQTDDTATQGADGNGRLVGDEEAAKTEPKWGVAPTPSPLSPGEDEAATHAATSEGAKQAAEKRAQTQTADGDAVPVPEPASNNTKNEQAEASKSVEPQKAKASKQVAEKVEPPKDKVAEEVEPDPHQNRMLLAGEKYLYGRGVAQDCDQAVIYLRAAAEEQNAPAMAHLGAMYASGQCVNQDRKAAYSWFARAQLADPKNKWITRNLNMLWRDMSPEQRAAIYR